MSGAEQGRERIGRWRAGERVFEKDRVAWVELSREQAEGGDRGEWAVVADGDQAGFWGLVDLLDLVGVEWVEFKGAR